MNGRRSKGFKRISLFAVGALLLGVALQSTVLAFNYVVDANGTFWGIQDNVSPYVDTGSIRASQIAPGGQTSGEIAAYSTALSGFGGIKVLVSRRGGEDEGDERGDEERRDSVYRDGGTSALRFNGELMRGFGLEFNGVDRFNSTQSVKMGGVKISRSVWINTGANWGRWHDVFTNTTERTITVQVAFGGQSGQGVTGLNSSQIVTTSDGDAVVTAADSWVEYGSPLLPIPAPPAAPVEPFTGGPQVTVLGTPSTPTEPFAGAIRFAGNWLLDSFEDPLVYTGHERNFQAYVNTLRIPPGKSRSLLHFIVLGPRVTSATIASERAEVELTANQLVAAPDLTGLTRAEVCTIRNFSVDALTAGGFDYDRCRKWGWGRRTDVVRQPPVPRAPQLSTRVDYEVFEKTIGELREDMESGRTTSWEITSAYLDRIAPTIKASSDFTPSRSSPRTP